MNLLQSSFIFTLKSFLKNIVKREEVTRANWLFCVSTLKEISTLSVVHR